MFNGLWNEMEKQLVEGGKAFISVTGGGGKTTFLIAFSSYLKSRGYSVLLSTSTKLAPPWKVDYKADMVFLKEDVMAYFPKKGETVFYAHYDEEKGKVVSPEERVVALLKPRYDVVIVEADGSRNLPFKIHTSRDPVIWKDTTSVVAICGMWGLGKRTGEVCFGEETDSVVDKDYLLSYISSKEGLSKGMDGHKAIYLFNGAEEVGTEERKVFLSLPIAEGRKGFLVSLREGKIYGTL